MDSMMIEAADTNAEPMTMHRRLARWAVRVRVERKLAIGLMVAAILSGLATYIAQTGWSPVGGPAPDFIPALLTLDFALLLGFGGVVTKQLVEVWLQRRQGLAGSRLHIRLVVLFSAVAVTPTIIVAIFSYLFLSIGMESWFSEKVRTALSESRAVAQAYLEDHQENLRTAALNLAADLNSRAFFYMNNPVALNEQVALEVQQRSLTDAIIFSKIDGKILARASLAINLRNDLGSFAKPVSRELEPLPEWAFARAEQGEIAIMTGEKEDSVRGLMKLESLPNAMLYVMRPVESRVLNHMSATNEAVDQYERLEGERSGYEISFIVIFGAGAVLLLLAAVWVGLNFATQISRRISSLVVAAEKVRSGDLSARADELDENDEFGSLSRAFNRMTGQLQSQQRELLEANTQLDLRRRFTEAVLSGVSAGVIGLDDHGLIHLPNLSASRLLGLNLNAFLGQPLARVVPEMAPLIECALSLTDGQVEDQIRILVGGRVMVLLVQISSERGDGESQGFVVTFDDITELLSAQRKAAWADVARRIAHEIKNPLTPIQLSAERLKRKYLAEIKSDPETFSICTDTIIRQVGDIGRMVDEFSSFARMPAPMMKQEDLQEIIRQALFLQRTAHPDILFDLEAPDHPVVVTCDSRQVSQALINLLQNAIDAIQGRVPGGDPAVPLVPGRVVVRLGQTKGATALAVEDNGKGLPTEGRERLIEPYVTTRTKGTGLGLAIVKKIMEDHAGDLVIADAATGGAVVSLIFPLKADMAQKQTRIVPQGIGQKDLLVTESLPHGA